MNEQLKSHVEEVAGHFQYEGELLSVQPYGNGHINDTYLLSYQIGKMGEMRVILQKMNRNVFPNPVELMENIVGVTEFLKRKIEKHRFGYEVELTNHLELKFDKNFNLKEIDD